MFPIKPVFRKVVTERNISSNKINSCVTDFFFSFLFLRCISILLVKREPQYVTLGSNGYVFPKQMFNQ